MIIAGKEFRSYLTSPIAYVVTAIFLALSGVFFVYYLSSTSYNDTSIKGFVQYGSIFLLLFAAVLTMRALAEEKKLGTWELLLTSPVKDSEVIVGKFFGSMGVLLIMLALTLYYPILLIAFGDPDIGPIWTSYLGMVLLGSAAFSVGIFASSLSNNQIISAVVSGGILFALWFIGTISGNTPTAILKVFGYISLSTQFSGFANGLIDTRSIVYFLSITVLFLYLATRSIDSSRWN
jgi:ABC-2 type transport system permease protein